MKNNTVNRVVCLFLLLAVFAAFNESYSQKKPTSNAKADELNFMLGDWKIEAKIRTSPIAFIKGSGTMKAYFDKSSGMLLADMKIKLRNFAVNGTTKRKFNPVTGRWKISWNPIGRPIFPPIEGQMKHGRFIEIDHGTDKYGSYIGRLVVFNITEKHFSVRKDQLYDDGTLMKDIWIYEATKIRN